MFRISILSNFTVLIILFNICCGPSSEKLEQRQGANLIMDYFAYFGSYTEGTAAGEGIYLYRFNARNGVMTKSGLAIKALNPMFLTVHPNQKYLYAVNLHPGKEGQVSAFKINRKTGRLKLLNQVSAGGVTSCYLSINSEGKMLAVANYSSGNTVSFPVNKDGTVGQAASIIQHHGSSIDPSFQDRPHAHSSIFSPNNRFVIAADVGTDEVYTYRANPITAKIEPHDPSATKVKPGSGPRHLVFHPSGQFCYVINEAGNTVIVFKWIEETGVLEKMQMIATVPLDFKGTSHTAEIVVHPSGKFLFGSNRGHDSIVVFSIDPISGILTTVEYQSSEGNFPTNFNLDPTGSFLFAANERSDSVVTFSVNQDSGHLTPTKQVLTIPNPACLRWVPFQ